MEDPDPWASMLLLIPAFAEAIHSYSFDLILSLAGMALLLFCSAMISGSETAYFSLGAKHLEEYNTKDNKNGQQAAALMEYPKRLLATILIANNFVNVAIVMLSTIIMAQLYDFSHAPLLGFFIQVVAVTALILLLGEIMPKVYATHRPAQLALRMAGPLAFLIKLFYPFSSMLIRSTALVDNRIVRKSHNLSMSDLSEAIDITSTHGSAEEERKILKGIVKFGDIEAKEIMKSRMDVTAVDTSLNFRQLLKIILEAGYSRVPAYHDSLDHITGILYIKDLLPYLGEEETFEWQSLLRPAFFVPESKNISDLLQEIQERKVHIAIVVDEYGGTSGIITLEDIIEEIVGEINDEFDIESEERTHRKIDENNWVFEGKTSLNDFCKVLGIEDRIFERVKGESDTLAGLILELVGKIPEKQEVIHHPPFIFRIEAADSRRIHRIRVTQTDED